MEKLLRLIIIITFIGSPEIPFPRFHSTVPTVYLYLLPITYYLSLEWHDPVADLPACLFCVCYFGGDGLGPLTPFLCCLMFYVVGPSSTL